MALAIRDDVYSGVFTNAYTNTHVGGKCDPYTNTKAGQADGVVLLWSDLSLLLITGDDSELPAA